MSKLREEFEKKYLKENPKWTWGWPDDMKSETMGLYVLFLEERIQEMIDFEYECDGCGCNECEC